MKYKIITLALLLSAPVWAQDTSALAARAPKMLVGTNHTYSPYKPELCKATPEVARDLEAFDQLLYAAAVNMRELCAAQASGRGASALPTYESNVDEIKLELKRFLSHGSLGGPAGNAITALDDQTQYIRTWVTTPKAPPDGGNKNVGAASGLLHKVHGQLMKLDPANSDAFYVPLCTLDFI